MVLFQVDLTNVDYLVVAGGGGGGNALGGGGAGGYRTTFPVQVVTLVLFQFLLQLIQLQ
jgi:hypothetical protein